MDDISEYWPWPIFPIILFSGIIVFSVVGYLFEKKRSRALEVIASSMGLSFRRKDKLPQDVKAAIFHLFSQGSSSIQNLMYAHVEDADISLFGYRYPKGRSAYNQTVALFYSEYISLPNFDLRPEHVFHKIGSVLAIRILILKLTHNSPLTICSVGKMKMLYVEYLPMTF